ncbi:glycosyltransferase family 2 protein [Bifidobacterium thermophilum]|uniref:glycosyltransferase family 2 protein n=1 Tax=Bifidobacterium thermophilum TaxID=33905 RepID=UPI003F93569B
MADKNQPLVSIVIPAYNVADYLDECLESVVSQTYANLEIVLVDDGSTDDTGVKCDAWAKKDIRIRVLHQKNGGLSAARNAGILHCNGEYLLALDSDDRIKQDLVRKCVSSLEDSSVDLVHFGYSSITESGAHVNNHPDPEAEGDELLLLILSNKLQSHSWQLLCKRGLYDGILFPQGRKAEDVATTYKLISRAGSSMTIPDCLYEYRTRKGSILASATSNPEKAVQYYVDELLAFREMIQWAKATGRAEYVRAAQNSMVHHLFSHYKAMLASHSEEGIAWVSNRLSEELRNIDSNSLEGAEKKKTAMFRNGSLAFCYRFDNALRKTAKQLLRRIRRVSK